jgi:hypothetical protein
MRDLAVDKMAMLFLDKLLGDVIWIDGAAHRQKHLKGGKTPARNFAYKLALRRIKNTLLIVLEYAAYKNNSFK